MPLLIVAILSTMLVLLSLTPAHSAPNTAPPQSIGVVGTYAPADFYVTDIDVDATGNIYAADLLQKHVTKYASDGTQLLRIADPEFNWPRTLTVDASGRIYVLDNSKGTIRVFSGTTGDLLSVWNGFDCAGELDTDNQGRILVAMNGNTGCTSPGSEVIVLDLNGTELFRFGAKGSGPGQFNRNYGITSGSDGTIVVTDIGNSRFQAFDNAGNYLFAVGSLGSDPGQFIGPRAPAIDSAGNIFISDRRNDRIQKFDAMGQFLTMWGGRGTDPGQFFEMDGIETGPDDTLWVAGYHAHDIQHFTNDGTFIERWKGRESGPGEFFNVMGIGVAGGRLFAVDGNNQRVQVFDSASGVYLYEFGERAQGDATVFNFPRALATGPDGDIYVTDDDNIRRIKADGTFVKRYDRLAGLRSGSLGLVVSAGGVIYQSDTGNHRINKIDAATGQLLGQWGSNGTGPGQFKGPRGIALDAAGRVYVADTGNSRVQVFDANGVYQSDWFSSAPRALAIDKTNDIIYVGQWAKVRAYSMTGTELFAWTGNGGTDGTFWGVVDIVLEHDGEVIHVSDTKNGRIQRFAFSDIVYGKPKYAPGKDLGIFIWQDADDGEWHVRFSGDNAKLYSYSIHIDTTSSFLDARTYSFEGNDVFQQTPQSLTLSGAAKNGEDGLDFFIADVSALTFIVTIDGQTEDLDVFVGANGINPLGSNFQLTDSSGDLRPSQSILFAEMTGFAGVGYTGESWGSAWGNLDADPYPDLWVVNHKKCPSLFHNLGDGTFEDLAGIVFSLDFCSTRWHDAHGAAWADFDNDGDQDLIQLVDNGADNIPDPNQLFINESGSLTDMATDYGADYQMGRGRTPLWLDWNKDGQLDLLVTTSRRGDGLDLPTALLEQDANSNFVDVTVGVGLALEATTDFALLAELSGDSSQELLPASTGNFPHVVYDMSTSPFVDIKDGLGLSTASHNSDAVIADFNGDLLPDMYLVQGHTANEVVQPDSHTIEASMTPGPNRAYGISFLMTGDLTVELNPTWRWTKSDIFIGTSGSHPAAITFTVSSSDGGVWGAPVYTPGTDKGLFLWFDPAPGKWTLDLSAFPETNVVLRSTGTISGIEAIGFDINEQPRPDQLLMWTGAGYSDQAAVSGISQPSSGRNIGVGDFDNDMDVDLYVVTSGKVVNLPNIFYENLGNGTFQAVTAFGAEGSLLGRGDAVSVADYDLDGFLDLFVNNGKSKEPFDLDGPSQLFHNQGNFNHWLEIDLQGVESNRDGVGARLFLTAGGITQVREQNTGAHFRIQNHQRIHFGLGQNDKVDRLEVYWPNGRVQVIENIAADQLIQVVEDGQDIFLAGQPAFTPDVDDGVYVWKDTFDGPYKIRATSPSGSSGYSIALLADRDIISVTPVNLEAGTVVDQTANSVSLTTLLSQSGEAGIDVVLAPGSKGLLAASKEGLANPRQISIGQGATRPVPVGWALSTADLVITDSLAVSSFAGMSLARDATGTGVEILIRGNGQWQSAAIDVLSSQSIQSVTGSLLENNDIVSSGQYTAGINGIVSGLGKDALNIVLDQPGLIGVSYVRDGMFQPMRASGLENLEQPNAYGFPEVDPYGKPVYHSGAEAGFFLWKDRGGAWHIKITAGGDKRQYTGTIVSDVPPVSVTPVGLESSDTLDTSDPLQVLFDLTVYKAAQDGIDLVYPEGASVSLVLNDAAATAPEVVVGQARWPIGNFPLSIGGWQ